MSLYSSLEHRIGSEENQILAYMVNNSFLGSSLFRFWELCSMCYNSCMYLHPLPQWVSGMSKLPTLCEREIMWLCAPPSWVVYSAGVLPLLLLLFLELLLDLAPVSQDHCMRWRRVILAWDGVQWKIWIEQKWYFFPGLSSDLISFVTAMRNTLEPVCYLYAWKKVSNNNGWRVRVEGEDGVGVSGHGYRHSSSPKLCMGWIQKQYYRTGRTYCWA